MYCLSIKSPLKIYFESFSKLDFFDAFEFRFDTFQKQDFLLLDKFLQKIKDKKVIFCIRKKSQGGFYQKDENFRILEIINFVKIFSPDFFDLEYDVDQNFLKKIKAISSNKVKIITSFHDFENSSKNIEKIFENIKNPFADFYKIAIKTLSSIESFKILKFLKENSSENNLTCIPIGVYGKFARVLASIYNNFNYFSLTEDLKTADGQLTLDEVKNIYRLRKYTKKTKLYGLLGNPIENSKSHFIHNDCFYKNNIDALYVKINLKDFEISEFFKIIKKFPFFGFSITMPLKEKIQKLKELKNNSKCFSINTLINRQNRWIGENTDGIGAIKAIEEVLNISYKKVLILGAGGAAKAICFALREKNAKIYIYNRTFKNAKKLADDLNAFAINHDEIAGFVKNQQYDLLINATSCSMNNNNAFKEDFVLTKSIVFDTIYAPKMTFLLEVAKIKNCKIIYGYKMLLYQALEQQKLWRENGVSCK